MKRGSMAIRGDLVLAVVLPVVCVAALLLTHPGAGRTGAEQDRAPRLAPLVAASVVCPSGLGSGDRTFTTTMSAASGSVSAGLAAETTPVEVRPQRVSRVRGGGGPIVVSGAEELAPGLVAGRSTSKPLAATDCRPASSEQWFTGLGSGATHNSVIELVNPNAGRAVADVVLWSQAGPLVIPELLGLTVRGRASTQLDLGAIAPRRGELTARVFVGRGRLAVHVADSVDELGTGLEATDWLAPQSAPQRRNVLLGLTRGEGERLLVLGNPGDSETRATIRIITPRAVFAPSDLEPVIVPPGSTKPIRLNDLLAEASDQGAIGLVVESSEPLTANLRQLVGDDLSEVAATASVSAATAAVVPAGKARLLLADADGVGAATITAYDAEGEELTSSTLDLIPDVGANVGLPSGTALVSLSPERASVRAALLIVDRTNGVAVVPFRDLEFDGLIPDARPGLF